MKILPHNVQSRKGQKEMKLQKLPKSHVLLVRKQLHSFRTFKETNLCYGIMHLWWGTEEALDKCTKEAIKYYLITKKRINRAQKDDSLGKK